MAELSPAGDDWNLRFGGDTLNMAIHMARAGHDVAYLTAIGQDPFSLGLRDHCAAEGVDCSLMQIHPLRQIAIYAISNDERGERSFTYWRSDSAARAMFELPSAQAAVAAAEAADLLCFSLISLAILPPEDRQNLLSLAARVRARGGLVAFDGNYRPGLWETPDLARRNRDAAIAHADIGLPTLEDERHIDGDVSATDVAGRWKRLGCSEVVVKQGAAGCLLPDGRGFPVQRIPRPTDTSGAGDAFNGGYLAARMGGSGIDEAARTGQALAEWTIMRCGAIPPRDAEAPYAG